MIQLGLQNVCLNADVGSKEKAIRAAGNLLVEGGNIQPGYIESMMGREATANTFLGNGIAIPHGLPKDRELILRTGISVVQIPDGVEWNPGERVHLVVGIAAKSDEHLQILTNLTQVLDDTATIERLTHTQDPQEIIERLTRGPGGSSRGSSNGSALEADFDQSVDLAITGKAGLHARPATAFVNLAKSFASEVKVRYGDQVANGKSLMSLLKLGVEQGQTIRVMAQGADAAAALRSLQAAVEAGLDEKEETAPTQAVALPALALESDAIAGVPASPGIAIAPFYPYRRSRIVISDTAADPQQESLKLRLAVDQAKAELAELHADVQQRSGDQAAIFEAHQELLCDPDLLEAATAYLRPNHSAAWAWQQTYEERAKSLEGLKDATLAGRAADVRDVGQRVLRYLADRVEAGSQLPDHPVILLADDLVPSDTAGFDPGVIQGFCTARGGATSHTAIIARALNIPAVVGAGEAILDLPSGTQGILDGNGGKLYAHPSKTDLQRAEQAQAEQHALQDVEHQARFAPALMTDGHRIEVVANIGSPAEAEQAVNAGGEGVGLLRTEFLFLGREQPPSETEQQQALESMTRALNGLPLIVRTLDIGGDKSLPYLNLPAEENPFLGVRGIRLCLQQSELFETQLRAIFQTAKTSYLRIMFPMIATLEELRAAKFIAESVRASVSGPPVEIGMMVEVPSAVLMAAEFAREVDFFSIGTNDLTQYLLAMDRGHPALAKQADGLHPAVLRAIAQTVQAAQAAGKWVGVCGGVASEPLGALILAGLGVAELSVSIPSIPMVKAALRRQSFAQTQQLAQQALRCSTASEVRGL
ncbi:phosphoenolpyruvate--protein phosphotransferase [Pseudanabaena sp. FACHB-2040]|uniref:phosphoenolpyruvate--protein phosphotransferase n=1 Tax=Pseudanabaena sp. FACHB-2040 TaxID=2692859 RepID=UPI001686B30F|nr:phosphoenolpyruvate--protein phosphotransferase [Pseudanabaena sp. FACHB-2040]MBD2257978.1 phosphoenolpyruvate--protein phosphotransferase [Pseudanabaena sp. FACHB-2040]